MRRTKGFSYDPEKDKDLMEYIRRKGGSQYIWNLVRKDMKGSDIVEIINRQIEEYLSKINFDKVDNVKDATVKESFIMGIDANDIQSILNL